MSRAASKDELYREFAAALISQVVVGMEGEEEANVEEDPCPARSRFGYICLRQRHHGPLRHLYTRKEMISPALFYRLLDLIVTRTTTARQGLDPTTTNNGYFMFAAGQNMCKVLVVLERMAGELGVELPSLAWTAGDIADEEAAAADADAGSAAGAPAAGARRFRGQQAPTWSSIGAKESVATLGFATKRLPHMWTTEHNDVGILCLGRLLSSPLIPELRVECFDRAHNGANPGGFKRAIALFENSKAAAKLVMDAAQEKYDLLVAAEQAAAVQLPTASSPLTLKAKGVMLEAARAKLEVKDCVLGFKLLVQHLGECAWDALQTEKRLENLGPKTFFATQDYKMKMLQVWFREASTRWYGKRGTSGHTTMWIFERDGYGDVDD